MGIRTRTSGITFEVAPPPVLPVAYAGPGDVVASAYAWWGLRAYTNASIGTNAVRLREDGGNTESDFATIAGGGLNLTAITAFKGANNLFVTKLYDQTGGGNDLIQATAGQQPAFTLGVLGTLPAMQFTAASGMKLALFAATATVNQAYTHVFVMNLTSIGSETRPFGAEAVSDVWLFERTGGNVMALYAGSVSGTAAFTAGSWHSAQAVFNGAASSITVDGATTSGLNPGAGNISAERLIMGDDRSGAAFETITGYITEGGIWPIEFSGAQLTAMNSNQHTYWGF